LTESQPLPARRRRRAAALYLCAGLTTAWALACGDPPELPVDPQWPPGALLSAQTDALRSLLAEIEGLGATPLARQAGRLRRTLPDCPEVEAIATEAASLPEALRCAEPSPALVGLRAHRGDAMASLALPLGPDTPRLLLRAHRRGADLELDVHWPRPETSLAALLPGSDPSGPEVLTAHERLFHVRVRVDGPLDLAALVPEGSQADELFRLRSELLSAAILDGTWEAAIYTPEPGSSWPRVAIALGVRLQSAAAAAADRLIDDVEEHWSVSRTPLPAGSGSGACLLRLRLLPELAPCYRATERALVLAWNPDSLRHAIAAGPLPPAATEPGRLELDLAGLRRTDLRLAQQVGPEALATVTRWPWRRLVAHGGRREDAWAFRVELEAGGRGGAAP